MKGGPDIKPREEVIDAVQRLVALAHAKATPPTVRRYVTVRQFAAMVGMSDGKARKLIMRLNEENGGDLLVNVGRARVRYMVELDRLATCAAYLFKSSDEFESPTAMETFDARLSRMEALVSDLRANLKKQPRSVMAAGDGWGPISHVAAAIGKPMRKVANAVKELRLKENPAMARQMTPEGAYIAIWHYSAEAVDALELHFARDQ